MAGRLVAALCLLLAFPCLTFAQIPASFIHGVASGDPLSDRVILWTRATPRAPNATVTANLTLPVNYTVYSDLALTNVAAAGIVNTSAARDFTVKVDVTGLHPSIQYYYRFSVGPILSDVGTFRLPPAAGQPLNCLRYFLFSCSSWGWGYFNAYDVASRYDLDFWVHLGDYFYEYSSNNYPSTTQAVRFVPQPQGLQPQTEIYSLEDYRQRHAVYRQDRGLQALSAGSPLIAIWDDHESANNAYKDGAENEDAGELAWPQRKQNSAQAWHEWIPIRDTDTNLYAINRTIAFGDLATIVALEDRLTARTNAGEDEPAGNPTNVPSISTYVAGIVGQLAPSQWSQSVIDRLLTFKNYLDTRRTGTNETMLGASQQTWINQTTAAATTGPLRTIWQQYFGGLVMQDLFAPDYETAIARARAAGNPAAALWQQTLDNQTLGTPGATYQSYSPTNYLLPNYSRPLAVSNTTLASARATLAMGRYKIPSGFDSWGGYIDDRNIFLQNIQQANNPVVYGGDTHNWWAGYLYIVNKTAYFGLNKTINDARISPLPVAVEFDVAAVSSTGFEASAIVPLPLVDAGFQAAAPSMFFSAVEYKGGIYVDLNRTNQHTEFIYVNSIATQDYQAFCGKAFDTPARANVSAGPQVIRNGVCGAVPEGRPYAKANILSEEARVQLPAAAAPARQPTVQAVGRKFM